MSDPGTRRTDRVLGVHGVRQGNVDGVHDIEARVEFVVGECMIQTIAFGDLSEFRAIAADDGDKL